MRYMPSQAKSVSRKPRAKPIQSVTIPAPLAAHVRRVAKQRHLTMSRTLVVLAERGLRAELDAKENLKGAYQQFMKEREPAKKDAAGKNLIRAIFGTEAIAEDPLLQSLS